MNDKPGKAGRLLMMAMSVLLLGCATGRGHGRAQENEGLLSDAERAVLAQGDPDAPLPVVRDTNADKLAFLRRHALPIDPKDPALPELLRRMRVTVDHEQGVGIAAPQVGVSRRVLLAQRLDKAPDKPFEVCLNPEFLEFSAEKEKDWEGCLSVTGGYGQVMRPKTVTLRCQGADGQWREERLSERTARIFQHEIDHLDGVLFFDRMEAPVSLLPKDEVRALREREQKEKEARQNPEGEGK